MRLRPFLPALVAVAASVSNQSSPGYVVLQASGTVTGTTDPAANAL